MTDPDPRTQRRPVPIYRIRLEGHLGRRWTDWFDGMTIDLLEDGHTLLTGPVADQATLHALLRRVRDLGMTIVSVAKVGTPPTAADDDTTSLTLEENQ